jgi:competence protein ComEA
MKKLLIALVLVLATGGTAMAAVNINTATKEELTTLKGIGENRAQEIINYRTKHGSFKTVDDLGKVPGIGPGILKQIRSNITVSGKTVVEPSGDTKTEAKKSEPAKSTTKTDGKSSASSSDVKTK